MASEAVRTSTIASKAYVRLESSDVKQILLNCKSRKIVIRHSFDLDVMEEKNNMKCEIERMEINYTFYFCLFEKRD